MVIMHLTPQLRQLMHHPVPVQSLIAFVRVDVIYFELHPFPLLQLQEAVEEVAERRVVFVHEIGLTTGFAS